MLISSDLVVSADIFRSTENCNSNIKRSIGAGENNISAWLRAIQRVMGDE